MFLYFVLNVKYCEKAYQPSVETHTMPAITMINHMQDGFFSSFLIKRKSIKATHDKLSKSAGSLSYISSLALITMTTSPYK